MRIGIIEDLLMVRETLREVCRRFGHDVVMESGSGRDGEKLVRQSRPELLLLDLRLPDVDGLVLAEQAMKLNPGTKVIILSAYCDQYTVFRIERLSVHGFIDKSVDTAAVLGDALDAIGGGRRFFSSTFEAAKVALRHDPCAVTKLLTEWERTILSYIATGCSNEEIAHRLGIAARTVQGHRSNMIRKLNVAGTPKLMAFAYEHGIAPPPCFRPNHGEGASVCWTTCLPKPAPVALDNSHVGA